MPYTIELWDRIAAFEAACLEWPTHEVTLRDGARIIERRERPPRSATG